MTTRRRGLGPSLFTLWRAETFLRDVRHGVRGLLKQPGFTLVVIVLLAVGIGANVAMFSAFYQALIRPLPYRQPENLVLGRTTFSGNLNPDMSAYDFFDYREQNRVFESVGAIYTAAKDLTITGGDQPERVSSVLVSWDLFPTLGVRPVAGRNFTSAEEELGGRNVVMISGGYWHRRFGASPDAVGSTVIVDGAPQTIVGVMPRGFQFLHDVDLWMPMRRDGPSADSRGWHNWFMVGRLRPGVTIERARADIDVIAAQLARQYPETNTNKGVLLTALHRALAEDYRAVMVFLMAAVGLVLLVACGNVASLLLARGATRRSELCMRAALGASSGRLVRQLLTESLVTAIAGGILGTVLAVYLQGLILYFVPAGVPEMDRLAVSWPMLAFALGVSVATGVLFGILPAIEVTRLNIAANVASRARTTDRHGGVFQSSLVVTQVALSLTLLIGSSVLLKSFANLRAVKPGFDPAHLLTTEIQISSSKYPEEPQRIGFFSALLEDLRQIPGVSDVAIVNNLPIRNPGNNHTTYRVDRPPPAPEDRIGAFWRTVLPGYFGAMGIPLVRGRGIEPSDMTDAPRTVVINETMARALFPNDDPLGKRISISFREGDYEIVGVVGDVRLTGTRYTPRWAVYASYAQGPTLTMRVAIRTAAEPASLAGAVRNAVWNRDRDIAIPDLESMEAIIARTVSSDKVVAFSATLFAVVAMLLAMLGLYGLLAYYVNCRNREIGIKMALGADPGHVVRPILRRGFSLVSIGIVLGIVGSLGMARLLRALLFGVTPTDTTAFVVASVFLAVTAFVACLLPALRALRVDPVTALAAQ